jgi:hypothetical protein
VLGKLVEAEHTGEPTLVEGGIVLEHGLGAHGRDLTAESP